MKHRNLVIAIVVVAIILWAKTHTWMNAHESQLRIAGVVFLGLTAAAVIWLLIGLRGPRYTEKDGRQVPIPFWRWLFGRRGGR